MTPNSSEKVDTLTRIAKKVRRDILVMSTAAGSGHPTTALSAADLATCLFFGEMHYNMNDPFDTSNDEFVLSKGHATPLLWACYSAAGLVREEVTNYRKFTSVLEGHPTPRMPWVHAATGSLGQGLSIALGIALAHQILGLPGRVYCLLGDGELAEGAVWEAASLAGHRHVTNLCAIADINRLGQSGPTMYQHDLAQYEKKFSAFGWHTIVINGHAIPGILSAYQQARAVKDKPTIILAHTLKGKGVSFLEDKEGWHGKALNKDELQRALAELEPVPEIDARKYVLTAHAKTPSLQTDAVPETLEPPSYSADEATRMAYGNALVKLGGACRLIVALDGDVKNSTFSERFLAKHPERFIECFIAEQNMVGMAVGLSAKGLIPFVSTFSAFQTRAHDFIRMAAYSFANIKFCGSHAGVSIGEDGPSQMGLEDIAMFRSIPNSFVLYPSDAVSAEKLTHAAARVKGIVYIRTTRPKTPILYKPSEEFPIGESKVVRQHERDAATVVAAGITLHEALKAANILEKENIGIRVLDCYSVKPIDVNGIKKAAQATRNNVIVVEDHYPEGGIGEAVAASILGIHLTHLAVREIPHSGKPAELMSAYKIDAAAIIEAVRKLLH